MAIRTISNAGGSWGTTTTWVGGIVPCFDDDVYATPTSGNLTFTNSGNYCKSFDMTGYLGTITNNGYDLSIGSSTANHRADNVAIYIPAATKLVNFRVSLSNQTSEELTVNLCVTDVLATATIAFYTGKFKVLNDLYSYNVGMYGSSVTFPLRVDFDGHIFNTVIGFAFSSSYNTVLLRNSTINFIYYASNNYPVVNVSLGSVLDLSNTKINYYGPWNLSLTNLSVTSWGAFDLSYFGAGGSITISSNLSIRNLSILPTTSGTLSIAAGKVLTITGDFFANQLGTPQIATSCTISGGTIYKETGIYDLYNVYVSGTLFTGGAIWNLRNNCLLSGVTSGINLIGGPFCVDIANGDDAVVSAYGWWKVDYISAVGVLPIEGEVITGALSGATAKVTGRINKYQWLTGSGTLYFYGKVGAFQAETVNSGSGSFHISQDLSNSAWKTFVNGANLTRVAIRDSIRVLKSPEPTSTGQLAKWTSCTVQAGGIASITPTSSSNTSPIVFTKALHGLISGDIILVCNHTVNTKANGIWVVTVLSSSTFSLNNSTGNGVGGATGQIYIVTSKAVILTTPVTKNICLFDYDWTSGVNVTSALLDKTDWKFNVGSLKIVTGAACGANQILAKYALPASLDLSGYQQISFWLKNVTTILNAGDLLVKLYSDAACTSEVNSFSIQAVGCTTKWIPITCDNHSNLSSTVAGVAIYTTIVQPGKTIYIDNIIACKDSSLPDSITLQSIISKNIPNQEGDDVFLGIQSIKDNIIFLDNSTLTLATGGRGYCGKTELVTLFKRETTKIPVIVTNGGMAGNMAAARSGEIARYFPYIGGWNNITNVSDGLTVYDGLCGWSYGISQGTYIDLRNFHCLRWTRGWDSPAYSSGSNIIFTNNSDSGLYAPSVMTNLDFIFSAFNTSGIVLQSDCTLGSHIIVKGNPGDGIQLLAAKIQDIIANNNYRNVMITNSSTGATKITSATFGYYGVYVNSGTPNARIEEIGDVSNCFQGLYLGSPKGLVTLVKKANYCSVGLVINAGNCIVKEIQEVSYSTGSAISFSGAVSVRISKVSGADNKYLINCSGFCAEIYIYNANFTGVLATNAINSGGSRSLNLINWSGTFIDANFYAGLMIYTNPRINCHNIGSIGDHRIFTEFGAIYSDSVERHSISGISWKLCPRSYYTSYFRDINYPLDLPIAKILCEAGVRKTVAIWCKKSHATDIGGRLIIRGGQFEGVGTPAADVFTEVVNVTDWQQISMSFTPTKTEVIEVEFWAYWQANLADESIWVDDISII